MPGKRPFEAKKEQAIVALMTHASVVQAAKAIGISERALRNWLQQEEFRSQFYQARHDLFQHAIGHIAQGLAGAAVVLRSIAMDANAPFSSRVTAAGKMFDLILKDIELNDIQVRMARIEEQLQRIQGEPSA